jgi:hypothetical protein
MKNQRRLFAFALCVAGCLLLSTGRASAATIYWGSSTNDLLFDSAGNPLDDSFTFELGTFGSFLPDASNVDQWLSNWKILDRLIAPAASGWNSDQSFFSGSLAIQADGTSSRGIDLGTTFVFSQGEQAYIWVYNSLAILPGSEWALVTNDSSYGNATDDWVVPALPDPCGCGSGADSLEWRLSFATVPEYGGVNDEYGEGDVSVVPPTFSLQTATIPEPSTTFLLLTAAGLLFHRRSRVKNQ